MYSGSARRLLVLLASARRWHTDLDMAVTTPPGRTSRQAKHTSARVPSLLALLGAHRPYRRAAGYGVATLGTLGLTLGMLAIRGATTPPFQGFGCLVVVVAAAAVGGLGPWRSGLELGIPCLQLLLPAPLPHLCDRPSRGRGGPVRVLGPVDPDLRATGPRSRASRGRRDPSPGTAHPPDTQRRAGRAGPRIGRLPV